MTKVTPLPKRIELTDAHIAKLNTIANDLEERAEALRRHAVAIRRHAAELQALAGKLAASSSSKS